MRKLLDSIFNALFGLLLVAPVIIDIVQTAMERTTAVKKRTRPQP
jgi:hypothetical protein